ncbi:MAG: glycosyltransferase family 4 protein [Pleurocapsa sp.]
MKILFLIARADTVGGAQVHVKDLAISLQQDGHKVLVVTGTQGVYNNILKQQGIESITCETLKPQIDPIKDIKSLQFIIQAIRQFQPDLISLHSSKTGILGRIASKITNVPCLFTAHGWSFTAGVPEPSRSIYQWIEKLNAPLANKIICVSECDLAIAIEAGMDRDRLITIHNGMKDISSTLRADPGLDNPVKVLMVARFGRQKDHHSLIEAFQHITGAELILVGDGSSENEIKSLVKRLDIGKKVKFLGLRKDVPEIMAQTQVYALISHWEGLPRTIIEAMRGGLPVVASDVGGVRELVEDGETGFVIPRGNVELLAQKLSELVNNRELRLKMGDAGRKKYESQFKFEYMYGQTVATYQKVLSNLDNR